jgi:hypothetical protein
VTIHLTFAGIFEAVGAIIVVTALGRLAFYAWLLWRWDKH